MILGDTIPVTDDLRQTLQVVVDHLAAGVDGSGAGPSYTEWIDYPKVELADALLRALGVPTEADMRPAPPPVPGRRSIPLMVRARVMARDGFTCQHCGATDDLTIDHIHPVCAGGTNDEANLQTLCGTCNGRKGRRVEA